MPDLKLTWEADEIRGGLRKIPGYCGHIPGYRNTLGTTYGTGSAIVLNETVQPDELKTYPSCILRHRQDGYTTKGERTESGCRLCRSVCVRRLSQ